MNRERCAAARLEESRPSIDKVLDHLLLKFAWDNLDARLVANTVRLVGKSLDWHGTVMIASQMPTAPPIVTAEKFKGIDISVFPTAEVLVRKSVTNLKTIQCFNAMVVSLAAVFQHSLLASDASEQISLDYLLRLSIRGSASGAPANIANLIMLDQPSNDADTARQLMDEACQITAKHSLNAGDPVEALRYCVMTADNPLYAQMQRILRDSPDGTRNASYERILPLAGHMHQSMAVLAGRVKVLLLGLWHGCLGGGKRFVEGNGSKFPQQEGVQDLPSPVEAMPCGVLDPSPGRAL